MKSFQFGKKQKIIWALFLIAAWGTVLFLLIRHHGSFSAQELANYRPEQPLVSALVMLGLFTLKSVDFLMHSGVLYAASGIMFPLPAALLLNTVGIVITVTPSYFLGRAMGPPIIESLRQKYPKLRALTQGAEGGSLAIAILLRSVGLPIQVGSLYMGAAHYRFGRFLLGSILGLLPVMVPYTLMGEGAGKAGSPLLIAAIAIEVIASVVSIAISAVMTKRRLAHTGSV